MESPGIVEPRYPGEAFYLGERIPIMQAGRVVQVGSSAEILARPAAEFIARMIRLWQARGLRGTTDSERRSADEFSTNEAGAPLMTSRIG